MFAICRLVGHGRGGLINQLRPLIQSSPHQQCLMREVQTKALAGTNKLVGLMEHDSHNAALKRPMSPHLTVYKFELTANLSISHRITGMMLTSYMYALAAAPIFFKDHAAMVSALASMPGLCHVALKLIIAYPLAYHLANGLRHLVWDSGKALRIKDVYSGGYAMLATSLAITALLMAL